MTEREFEQLRPWLDGMVTDVGYKPAGVLIRKGWLRHEFDNFYSITAAGLRACDELRCAS